MQLITHASPVGLGAVLIQVQGGCERVVPYESCSVTDVERRYSLKQRKRHSDLSGVVRDFTCTYME